MIAKASQIFKGLSHASRTRYMKIKMDFKLRYTALHRRYSVSYIRWFNDEMSVQNKPLTTSLSAEEKLQLSVSTWTANIVKSVKHKMQYLVTETN